MSATVFFDLETGGILPTHPDIQLAAVVIDDKTGAEIEAFEAKLKFDPATADPAALKMNCYEPQVWELQARDPLAVVKTFSNVLNRYRSVTMTNRFGEPFSVARLCGHNAATFDGPRLQNLFRRLDVFLPADPRVRCTMQRALWYFDETDAEKPKNLKLETLCAYFGVPIVDAHDALADVRATAALARAIRGATRRPT